MSTALIIVSLLMVLGWYRAWIWKRRWEYQVNIEYMVDRLPDMSHVTYRE